MGNCESPTIDALSQLRSHNTGGAVGDTAAELCKSHHATEKSARKRGYFARPSLSARNRLYEA